MALPTTGTIKHSHIMAEFEKTGQFKLSADGAPLIDKSPSTLIKESNFYGASNVPAAGQGSIGGSEPQPNACFTSPTQLSGNLGFTANQSISDCGWYIKLQNRAGNWNRRHAWTCPWKCLGDGSTNIRFSYGVKVKIGDSRNYATGQFRVALFVEGSAFGDGTGWVPIKMDTVVSSGANGGDDGKSGFYRFAERDEFFIDDSGSVTKRDNGSDRKHSFVNISQVNRGSSPDTPLDVRLEQFYSWANSPGIENWMYYVKMENV